MCTSMWGSSGHKRPCILFGDIADYRTFNLPDVMQIMKKKFSHLKLLDTNLNNIND
jgi:hypothetical protein